MSNPADAVAGRPAVAAPGLAGLVESWRQIVFSGNLAPGRPIDAVSRWLLITRACVFPMTLTSGLIGGVLAATTAPAPNWGYFALALLGRFQVNSEPRVSFGAHTARPHGQTSAR